ncbi:MAG: S8 family serine peptidase, partial [Phormidium sp. BM_Day4_Bin.17]|nr:S8 family serine peptidase [Phormidium sp. BM_Day4_Bin.17]
DESEESETDGDEEISDELDESEESETDGDEEISDELDESEESESETDDDISDEGDDEEAGEAEADDDGEDNEDESEDPLDDEEDGEDEEEDEDDDELPFSFSVLDFDRGVFRVGDSGEVGVDFLFDGGAYQGEVAFFSLAGLEEMEFETTEQFIAEAAKRAASGSAQGHTVISVADEGARFTGSLFNEPDWNTGPYQGVKTFNMTPGDEFGVMLVPNGRVSDVVSNPSIGGSRRPLFSLSTANPDDEFHLGQIADLTGDGNTFVFEDQRFEISDYDYDDVIFQIRGAVGDAVYVGDVIAPDLDWRDDDMGKALLAYSRPYITPVNNEQWDLGELAEFGDEAMNSGDDLPSDGGGSETEVDLDDLDEVTSEEAETDSLDEAEDEVTNESDESDESDVAQASQSDNSTADSDSSDSSSTSWPDTSSNESDSSLDNSTESTADPSPESSVPVTDEAQDSEGTDAETTDEVEVSQENFNSSDDEIEEISEESSSVSPAAEPQPLETPTRFEFVKEDQPLVGVIDTGFAENNPDLDYDNITLGRDWVDGNDNPLLAEGEGNEHGTHILGLIAAQQDNGIGIDGINPDAPIWLGRAVGSGEWANSLVEFVDAAVESGQPNAVVNLSMDLTQMDAEGNVTTRYEFTPQEREALGYARQNGVLLVVAAGNNADVMSVLGQASQEFDNIITVGAAEQFDPETSVWKGAGRTEYSSYGRGLDVMAYGGTVDNPRLSLTGDGLGTMAGSSVATAKVTGAVSQVWAANPELSYRQVVEIIKNTATDLGATGHDLETGAGLVNMTAAVLLAKVTKPEEYAPAKFLIPDTWSGEGKVTALSNPVRSGITNSNAQSNSFRDNAQYDFSNIPVYVPPPDRDAETSTTNGSSTSNSSSSSNSTNSSSSHHTNSGSHNNSYSTSNALGTISSFQRGVSESAGNSNTQNSYQFGRYLVKTPIYNTYQQYKNRLGNPTGNQYNSFRGSFTQRFARGRIVSSPKGNFALFDKIADWYGFTENIVGLPTEKEFIDSNGYRHQLFENGGIYYNPSHGQPTAYRYGTTADPDVTSSSDSSQTSQTQPQTSVNPPSIPSNVVNGYTINAFSTWRAYKNTLGNPISSEYQHSSGARYQYFEHGSIVTKNSQSFPLYGSIRQKYLNEGGLNGLLGAPTSFEVESEMGSIQQYFENGHIFWNGSLTRDYHNPSSQQTPQLVKKPQNQPTLIRTGGSDLSSKIRQLISDYAQTKSKSAKGHLIGPPNSLIYNYGNDYWTSISGESAQFGEYARYTEGDLVETDMPDDALEFYEQFSTALFGKTVPVTAGYARDRSYYSYYDNDGNRVFLGAHSGIDLDTRPGDTTRSLTSGKVVFAESMGDDQGYWVAIDEGEVVEDDKGEVVEEELDQSISERGRRWWYGHFNEIKVKKGDYIKAGDDIGTDTGHSGRKKDLRHHLHLTVVDFNKIDQSQDSVNWLNEISNGNKYNSDDEYYYNKNIDDVLSRTVNPLYAYLLYQI